MKYFILSTLIVIFVSGCVSAPPKLSLEDQEKAKAIKIYEDGDIPETDYSTLGEVEVADCSGQGGGFVRISGKKSKAIEGLMHKAYVMNADAIINTQCGPVPYVNNCWVAFQCTGIAVKFN